MTSQRPPMQPKISVLTMRSWVSLTQSELHFFVETPPQLMETAGEGLVRGQVGGRLRTRLGKRKMLYEISDAALGCLIPAFIGPQRPPAAEADAIPLHACDGRYYSHEGFRIIPINIESAPVSLDRRDRHSRVSREHDLRALRTRKGIDV